MSDNKANVEKFQSEAEQIAVYAFRIETLEQLNQFQNSQIESLKAITELKNEEIQGLKNVIEREQHYANTLDFDLKKQTSITELAVKGLKEAESDLKGLHTEIGRNTKLNPATRDEYQAEISYIGQSIILQTLSEIARLSQ